MIFFDLLCICEDAVEKAMREDYRRDDAKFAFLHFSTSKQEPLTAASCC